MSSASSFARAAATPLKPTIALVEDTGVTGEFVPITSKAALTISDLADLTNFTRTVKVVNTVDGTSTSAPAYSAPSVSGTYQVVVSDVDTVTGTSVTAVFTFTLDLDAPVTPTLRLVTDTSGTDLITSDGTLVAVGAEAGAKVEYLVAGGPGTTTATWTTTLPDFTVDGKYTVFVRQTDAAGNVSEISDKFVFTLDKTPPAKPVVALAFDGSDGTIDGITDKDGFTVTGNASGDVIEYSLDQGVTWTAAAPDKLANGDYEVLVRLKDVAGNTSPASDPLPFTINKTVPGGPDNPQITNDSGADDSDGITNEIPTLETDTLPTGAKLQFQVKGTTAWVDTLSASDFAADGSYTIVVRLVSANGSVSLVTEEVDFTLDTTVETIAATLTNGTTANGKTTVSTTPVFDIDDDGSGAVVEFSTDDGATWQTIDKLSTLKVGDYALIFHQIDVAGNISTDSDAVTFTLTNGAPDDDRGGISRDIGSGSDGPGGLSGSDFGWF